MTTSMNERTHFFIKNISHTLYSQKGWCWLWEVSEDKDGLLFWPKVFLTIAALLPHRGWGCSTMGHWGLKALCLPLALNSASCLQLTPTGSNGLVHHVLPLFFRLFTQVHLSWLTTRSRINMLHTDISSRDLMSLKHQWNVVYRDAYTILIQSNTNTQTQYRQDSVVQVRTVY